MKSISFIYPSKSSQIHCVYPHIGMTSTRRVNLQIGDVVVERENGELYIENIFRGTSKPLQPYLSRRPKMHPATWKQNKKLQMVWPRDKKQKGAHTWDRLADILTGKGPDMWVSRQYSRQPHRPVWSGWTTKGYYPENTLAWDNLGYPYRKDNTVPPPKWARRGSEDRYDFKSRRYRRPRAGIWSDVKWSNQEPHVPLYHRDRNGVEAVEPEFDGGWANAGLARNPFRFNHRTVEWDWNKGDRKGW